MIEYWCTGRINGRRYSGVGRGDLELVMKMFLANNLTSLWKKENGITKLLLRKGKENGSSNQHQN